MWHRLSVHVKRQEAGSNQMAVIKPLASTYQNTSQEFADLSTKTLYNVAEEDESDPVHYNSAPSSPMMAHGQTKDVVEEVKTYSPKLLQQNCIIPQHAANEDLQEAVSLNNSGFNELRKAISMSQAASSGMPVYHQAHLIQQDPVLPIHLDPFDDDPVCLLDEEEEDNEQCGLLQGYMYNNAQINDKNDLVDVKLKMEDSVALMPPSPFRDCAGPPVGSYPNSPVSESILCTPPNATYASVIFRDFKQSSSTL